MKQCIRILVLMALVLWSAPARAQFDLPGQIDPEAIQLPSAGSVSEPKHWQGYAMSFLLTAAVLAMSLQKPKRTHQD